MIVRDVMKFRGRRALACRFVASAFFLAAGIASCPAIAQGDVERLTRELTQEIKRMQGQDEQLEKIVLKAYGPMSQQKTEVAKNTMKEILGNPRFARYLATMLAPLEKEFSRADMMSAYGEAIVATQAKGFARLSADRQARFVQHVVAMLRWLDPGTCKSMAQGTIDTPTSTLLERRFMATLSLPRFQAITQLYREAVEAELNGYPDARTINANQARIVEKLFEAATVKRLKNNVPMAAITRYNDDAASAPAEDVCSITIETLQSMLDLSEPYRSWQLTRYVEALQ